MMGTLAVVEVEASVEVLLELLDRFVESRAEGDGKELLYDGALEGFGEAVGLRRVDLCAALFGFVESLTCPRFFYQS